MALDPDELRWLRWESRLLDQLMLLVRCSDDRPPPPVLDAVLRDPLGRVPLQRPPPA